MSKLKELGGRIFEAEKSGGKLKYPVVIISQGLGNLSDRNYYSAEAIKTAPAVYEGKKAYYDHPTPTQESEMPGRSVQEICGHYENCKVTKDENGMLVLKADFVPMKSKTDVIDLIEHSIEYAKKYKDQQFIGISINGDGEGDRMDYESFVKEIKPSKFEMEKISQVEGQPINVIKKFTDAVSADLVTEAGARGRVLQEFNKIKRRKGMLEAMKKFLLGSEKQDKKLMEEAVNAMLQSEGDEAKKKEDEKKEDEAQGKKAEGLVKALLAAKKEMKKEEGESDEQHEVKCMKQALKKHEDEMKKEADEKHEDEKKEDEKKEEFPPKKDDKKDEKHDDDEEEKKESDDKKDDEKHDDADQDKALIKKMMKQMDEMKKEVEALKSAKKESEDEAKKHHEESVKAKIELEANGRIQLVETMLAESGLPRSTTKHMKDLMLKAKGKEEMKKLVEAAREVHSKAIESAFYSATSFGFTEIEPGNEAKTNDQLFK